MNKQNWKRQHLEEQQEEEDYEICSSVGINSKNLEIIQAPCSAIITSNQSRNGTTTSIIGGQQENGKDMNELEITHLKAKVQMLETEKQQLSDKLASVEEQYLKEIAELKVKLTEQNEAFVKKLKELEETMQMNQQNFGEKEKQICLPTRQMKIQLPLENWHDLLASVPRSQLGNVVSQIGDRQFAYILQSFLHDEAREITLGEMWVIPPRPSVFSDRPMVKVWRKEATNVPNWPMPGNVKNFVEIDLDYLDISVLHFLREFQANSLLENVNLDFYEVGEDILLRVLTQILPLISSIDSIKSSADIGLFNKIYQDDNNNGNGNVNKWASQLPMLKTMMAQTRILYLRGSESSWEGKVDWFCRWLYTPRDDGKPRMLTVSSYSSLTEVADCSSFLARIKKDFERATESVSFFILIRITDKGNLRGISSSAVENVKTEEKLVIKETEFNEWWTKLLISRHPLKAAKKWIEANEEEIMEWDTDKLSRKIWLDEGAKISM